MEYPLELTSVDNKRLAMYAHYIKDFWPGYGGTATLPGEGHIMWQCNVNNESVIKIKGRVYQARRLFWTLYNQKQVPTGYVLHCNCSTMPEFTCVQPEHQKLVKKSDFLDQNLKTINKKTKSKLTTERYDAIVKAYLEGRCLEEIAKILNIKLSVVSDAIKSHKAISSDRPSQEAKKAKQFERSCLPVDPREPCLEVAAHYRAHENNLRVATKEMLDNKNRQDAI